MSYDTNAYSSLYEGRSHEIARPTGNEVHLRALGPLEVAKAQAAWDAAHERHQVRMAYIAESAAKAAKAVVAQRREQAAREAEVRAKADEAILQKAWDAFRDAGGSAAEFESIKADVLATARKQAAIAAATKAVAAAKPQSMRVPM